LAYLAGAIDSDGYIGIKRSTYAMRVRGDAGQPMYSERVSLHQVTPHIPELLRETFGGSCRVERAQAVTRRPLFVWNATDLRAAAALRALRPYLRIKAEQADNALALRVVKEQSKVARVLPGRGHMGGSVRPAALGDAMEVHYLRAKELNHVGV
jgi:hypothetical protein